jgi:type I restriction enzyme S subunit
VKSIRLGEVAKIYNGNSINERVKAQNFIGLSEGTPYIATKDISYTFQVDYENGVKIPESNSSEFKLARKGSVLLCAEGGSAGRKSLKDKK